MEPKLEFCVIYGVLSLFAYASAVTTFRPDYQYDKKTRSYYKIHVEFRRLFEAKDICDLEGASLMVPSTEKDISVAHGMIKKFPDIGNYFWVGNDEKQHPSAEEEAIIDLTEEDSPHPYSSCEVITREGKVMAYHSCWQNLPFLCKVEQKNVFHDETCGINIKGYTRLNGSCYKIPGVALTWNGAYDECQNEGAHLLVVNSEAEYLNLKDYVERAPRLKSAFRDYFYYAGFRADKETKVFKTIFNQTLDEAGFNRWSEGEPNNAGDSEYCGSVFRNNALFNDVDCSNLYAFICEKEING